MNEKLKPFLALQEFDSRRGALRRRIEAAEKRKAAIRADLAASEAGKAKADDAKRIREKHLMDAQLRLKSAEVRRTETEARQLRIANQKEFQALNDQLETQKKDIGALEDEVLGLMEAVEGVKRDAEYAAKALRDQVARTDRIGGELEAEISAARVELEETDRASAESERGCDGELLAEYKRLAKRANGIALASAVGGVCQACYTRVPPQVENLLAGHAVVNCRSCQVLLYLP